MDGRPGAVATDRAVCPARKRHHDADRHRRGHLPQRELHAPVQVGASRWFILTCSLPVACRNQRSVISLGPRCRHGDPWRAIACITAVHVAAATCLHRAGVHSVDVPWWEDLVAGPPKPLIKDGFIAVPSAPGLGIGAPARTHQGRDPVPEPWTSTEQWDAEWANDRQWS